MNKLELLHKALAAEEWNLSEWTRWDPEEEREQFRENIKDLKELILEEEMKK